MSNRNVPVKVTRRVVQNDQLNLSKIYKILKRRKLWLFGILAVVLTAVGFHTMTSPPVYEASVLLKKEKQEKQVTRDDLQKIISLKTLDEIETEVALVKTWDVLQKVVEELNLNISVDRLVAADGSEIEIKDNILDYERKYLDGNPSAGLYPKFSGSLTRSSRSNSFYVVKQNENVFELYDASNDNLISTVNSDSSAVFYVSDYNLNISWNDAKPGSKAYFTVAGYHKTLRDLSSRVSVDQQEKTDVFRVSVAAHSPYAAMVIANTLTEKFRDSRIEQQKQTIRYSFDFVDENLKQIETKLMEAEQNLTDYKSSQQIMDISGSSADLVRFISELEAEKLRNELELAQFKNKLGGMTGEKSTAGYFDQTFLTPQGTDATNSPFSTLMRQQADLELKRLNLLQKRTENHPEVVAIDEQISTIKEKLAEYNDNTLMSFQIIISSLEEKNSKLNSMMSKYEDRMRVLPTHENKLANLMRETSVYSKMYALLLDKREEMRMAELSKLQDIVIVDPAHEPIDPIAPRKAFNMMAGLVVGTLLAFVGVFLVEARSKRKIQLDDVEDDFKYPIYAIIPQYSKSIENKIKNAVNFESTFVTLMDEQEGFRESFRVLRTKINTHFEYEKKILMFTSCEENTGKTSIVANLAISIAQSNKRVLVVDCDLKKGTLSRTLNVPKDSPGLITFLRGEAGTPYIYNKIDNNLDILPAGGITEDSSELIGSDYMKKLYKMISSSDYDYIIFDTPPVTRVVDGLILGRLVQNVVLILRPEHTFKDSVKWGIHEMEQSNMNIIGTVINAGNIEKSSFKYRYGYGYGYAYNDKEYKRTALRLGA
jgi:tyrosine-protein kinase Etk/Wzc